MKVYVVGSSALYYWRNGQVRHQMLSQRCGLAREALPSTPAELDSANLTSGRFGAAPIHLIVPHVCARVAHNRYRYSVHADDFSEPAFCELDQNICIASPELCLMQSARVLPKYRLIELCTELCGTYSLSARAQRGFFTREYKLTNTKKLTQFAKRMKGEPGAARLIIALQYVTDGSRSPMETREYLLACLPKRYGGYGLPKAALNKRIFLTPDEQRLANCQYLMVDMFWENKGVIIEYDGHDDHASRSERARDADRRNLLISRGYEVYVITSSQIGNVEAFDGIMRRVAHSIGYPLRAFPANWTERRAHLRRELFKSLSYEHHVP